MVAGSVKLDKLHTVLDFDEVTSPDPAVLLPVLHFPLVLFDDEDVRRVPHRDTFGEEPLDGNRRRFHLARAAVQDYVYAR